MTTSPQTQPDAPESLGRALRTIRTARRLSLQEVADGTAISTSFLSLVEKDRSDITIGRLVRLLEFYGVSITDLLPFAKPKAYPQIVRVDDRTAVHSPAEGVDVYLLTPDTARQMMPLEVVFEPGAGLAEPGRHAGEEWVVVLEGRLRIELDGSEPRVLGAGDSAYYPAERPHLLSNASETEVLRIVCVDTPPTM
ncbi:MAG TPA: cupin domain-containing protein [Gaiellaceae bacterium]